MRRKILVSVFVLTLLPAMLYAGQVSGTIQGYSCVTQGKACPIGKEDPLVAIERVFVLKTSGQAFYFIPNVDRAVLARHLLEEVRVIGELNKKYKSITAKEIKAKRRGKWRIVWSIDWEKELQKKLGFDDPDISI